MRAVLGASVGMNQFNTHSQKPHSHSRFALPEMVGLLQHVLCNEIPLV